MTEIGKNELRNLIFDPPSLVRTGSKVKFRIQIRVYQK